MKIYIPQNVKTLLDNIKLKEEEIRKLEQEIRNTKKLLKANCTHPIIIGCENILHDESGNRGCRLCPVCETEEHIRQGPNKKLRDVDFIVSEYHYRTYEYNPEKLLEILELEK